MRRRRRHAHVPVERTAATTTRRTDIGASLPGEATTGCDNSEDTVAIKRKKRRDQEDEKTRERKGKEKEEEEEKGKEEKMEEEARKEKARARKKSCVKAAYACAHMVESHMSVERVVQKADELSMVSRSSTE